jgi:hypothetical protein
MDSPLLHFKKWHKSRSNEHPLNMLTSPSLLWHRETPSLAYGKENNSRRPECTTAPLASTRLEVHFSVKLDWPLLGGRSEIRRIWETPGPRTISFLEQIAFQEMGNFEHALQTATLEHRFSGLTSPWRKIRNSTDLGNPRTKNDFISGADCFPGNGEFWTRPINCDLGAEIFYLIYRSISLSLNFI